MRWLLVVLAVVTASSAARANEPPTLQLKLPPSYIQSHSERVMRDMLFFAEPDGAAEQQFPLERLRALERLRLLRERRALSSSLEMGAALFGAATVIAAHAPPVLRAMVDGKLHLGPAIFDGGGMGIGLGGRWL
jgi:hypothetical protein